MRFSSAGARAGNGAGGRVKNWRDIGFADAAFWHRSAFWGRECGRIARSIGILDKD